MKFKAGDIVYIDYATIGISDMNPVGPFTVVKIIPATDGFFERVDLVSEKYGDEITMPIRNLKKE